MSGVFFHFTRAFDFLFAPFDSLHPAAGLAVVSFFAGVAMLLVFRFTSNQKEIRRVKDRIQAHLLAGGLFQDDLGVVLRSHARAVRATLGYMKHSLLPLAVMLIPIAWLLVQLDLRLGWLPLKPGEPFLLTARVADPASLQQLSLRLPEGLTQTAPPLRIAPDREIDFRLQAGKPGDYTVEVQFAGQTFTKQITVAGHLPRLSFARVRADLLDAFLNPGEPPFAADAPLEAIEINYRRRSIPFAGFRADWLVHFFLLSLVSGFALKGFLRTEI